MMKAGDLMAELRYAERTLCLIDALPGKLNVTPDEFDRIKRSSTYRFLCILSGECRLFLSGASYRLGKNDFCFFRPGDLYQTVPVRDMQVMNLYFSFDREDLPELLHKELDRSDRVKRYDVTDCTFFNDPFVIKDFPQGAVTAQEIRRESRENKPYAAKKQELLLNALALDVVRYLEKQASARETDGTTAAIFAYIRQHIREKLTCRELAERFSYHPNYLNQMTERAAGLSLHRYIMEEKIRSATEELTDTEKSITEIAQEYAFYDSSHFVRSYVMVTGLRPSDVRKAARQTEEHSST